MWSTGWMQQAGYRRSHLGRLLGSLDGCEGDGIGTGIGITY